MASYLRRLNPWSKPRERSTITYGDTVQAENRKRNWDRRVEQITGLMICKRPKGPCDKFSYEECSKCKNLDEAMERLVNAFVISQSQGEMGDRYPVTTENHDAWRELYAIFITDRRKHGSKHPWVRSLAEDLEMIDLSFAFRSTRREHTRVDVASPAELFKLFQLWSQQSGRPTQIKIDED